MITEYNYMHPEDQKVFGTNALNFTINGFNDLGLDHYAANVEKKLYDLRRDIPYKEHTATNEKGQQVRSAIFNNIYDALEAQAADIEYRTKLAKQRNISDEDLSTYVNAMYNLGQYHKDLNDMDFIRNQYNFNPYYDENGKIVYKLGGMNKLNKNGNVPSTGKKIKADVGTTYKLLQQFSDFVSDVDSNDYSSEFGLPIVNFTPSLTKPSIIIPNGYYKTKGGNVFKNFENKNINRLGLTTGDLVNLGVNASGSLINLASRHSLPQKPIKYNEAIPFTAIKNKTKININPRLREIDKTINAYKDSIYKNTSDSSVALNRVRDLNLNRLNMVNDLYNQKETQETALINQDNKNLENIINQNIQTRNIINQKNLENDIQTANLNRLQRADAITDFTQNIAQSTENIISNIEKRKQFDKNLKTIGLGYSNINVDKLLKIIGLV